MAFNAPPKNELASQILIASTKFVDDEIENPDRHDYAIFAKAFLSASNLTLNYYTNHVSQPNK